ncbi:MAG: FAD-binding oxidoreductase [Vicinamibacterales bacterium]
MDIRPADPGVDAMDDVEPGIVVEPRSVEGMAAALKWASANGLATVVRGAGTKRDWGRVPPRVDVLLGTRHLNRVLVHRAGDLTVSVEAGITLDALNRMLSSHGQCLPLDPPFGDRATIGGLVATNDSGPLRHRFGTPRDLVIGIQLATTDGRITKAGGQVVKNVAGYDLSKLMSGSFGSLAAITGATFKLAPLPGASTTLQADGIDSATIVRMAAAVGDSQLEQVAFDLHALRGVERGQASTTCLVRIWSPAGAIDRQVEATRALLASAGANTAVLAGDADAGRWQQHAQVLWPGEGAVVRVSWLPADLASVLALLESLAAGGAVEMAGRIGVGAGLIRIAGHPSRQAAAIQQLRSSTPVRHVVVVRAGPEVKAHVDVWGPQPNARLLQSIKAALDPAGILGAGRGPL